MKLLQTNWVHIARLFVKSAIPEITRLANIRTIKAKIHISIFEGENGRCADFEVWAHYKNSYPFNPNFITFFGIKDTSKPDQDSRSCATNRSSIGAIFALNDFSGCSILKRSGFPLTTPARLQGIPDSWTFFGTRTSIARQIGNGVPVPLGKAVAHSIKDLFYCAGILSTARLSSSSSIDLSASSSAAIVD